MAHLAVSRQKATSINQKELLENQYSAKGYKKLTWCLDTTANICWIIVYFIPLFNIDNFDLERAAIKSCFR